MRACEICKKGSKMGGARKKLRGNYNPVNWTRKYPNLQKTRTLEGKRVLACTDCIKKMSKLKK
jgi:ribosomal protein L28